MDIYIEPGKNFTEEIRYVFRVFAGNKNIQFVDSKEKAGFIVDSTPASDLPVAVNFYNGIKNGNYGFTNFLANDLAIKDNSGNTDYIATAFYMMNSLQEYNASDLDEIGRFRFENSYQHKYNCITRNIVQECFDKLAEYPKLSALKRSPAPSSFLLSHDIDTVNGALMQDGLYLAKKFKPVAAMQLLFNVVLQKPDWLNMDKIMQVEDEYSFKSTFYWIVNKGKVNTRMVNADYDIGSTKMKGVLANISKKGWDNGLHKSVSDDSFSTELKKLGIPAKGNRYHYLRFRLPQGFDEIEKAGLQFDTSLGFAEAYGFRNSYGQPFQPFNLKERRAYKFVEAPLHIMDGTFQRYMKIPVKETAERAIAFMEANKQNCTFSILWHNTFFTQHKYKGYLDEYKNILAYLYESKFSCKTQQQIIDEYLVV